MIELAQHIETLLLENDCIIVPGFGGFVAHYNPAIYIKEENLFIPPTRSIGFNPQLKLNDGVLVQSYMSVHDTSFADATRMVEKEANTFINLLHKEGKAYLENIGEIHYNIYGNYEFIAYDHKLSTPSLYGLDAFEIHELSATTYQEKVLTPSGSTREGKTYHISISRTFLRNAAAMIAAVIMFFAFSTPVENTYIKENNYAQLLPSQLFEQIEKQSIAVTPVLTKTSAAASAKIPSTKTQQKRLTADKAKISTPVKIRKVTVAQPEPTSTSPATSVAQPQVDHPYHLIVMGGISLKDAKEIAEQLIAKGFPEAKALNTDGKVRVSIRSFENREEATKQLLELRKDETYKNAWLLAK